MTNHRVKTGVYGLDEIIKGGLRPNTVNVVFGGTGVGKTTFAFQYSLYGLLRGEKVVYLSMEMNEEQIIRGFKDFGWNEIETYLENEQFNVFKELSGKDSLFYSTSLRDRINENLDDPQNSRIIIDPLTPLNFSFNEESERKEINRFFESLRDLGTTIVTLEKHGVEESGSTGVIPLYLADSVIQLQNLGFGELYDRTLKIIKHRGSDHGEGLYPFDIFKGTGIIVETSEEQLEKLRPKEEYTERFEEAKQIVKKEFKEDLKESILKRIELLEENWTRNQDPKKVINHIIKTEKAKNVD